MKRRLLALSLAAALFLALACTALAVEYGAEPNPNEKTYSQTFSDVPTDHWAFEYIGELVERGAVNGYPDGNFYPNKIVTREEFAKIMVVAAGMIPTATYSSSYADVPADYWASPYVEAARPYMTAYQMVDGLYFQPKAGALREDIAVAVVKLKGYDTRLADLSILDAMFSDVSGISESARPYVALAVETASSAAMWTAPSGARPPSPAPRPRPCCGAPSSTAATRRWWPGTPSSPARSPPWR